MTKKNIYKSCELPDHTLEEFEDIRNIFFELIELLSQNHSVAAVNAGLSKAQLDLLKMASSKEKIKQVILAQAEYLLQAAENVSEI